ncbi:unnamed protein product [Linum trigynum]|uniref:Uncharacterized protein n=1 Tax=Linum trigynum TaxID=586398 RepID=A0AAV2F7Y7_9ROSI
MSGVASHPQWRQLLSMDEFIYHELCVEFYSTFTHVIPTSKKGRPYVDFMLGGQPRVLAYDAFAQAMGLDTMYRTMTERHYTVDFHYQAAFTAFIRPEHEHEEYEASVTNAVKLTTPWRILHTFLTRSVVPSQPVGCPPYHEQRATCSLLQEDPA